MSANAEDIYASNSNFLKVADLNGQKVNVTISATEIGEVGAEKKKQIVLTFQEDPTKKFGLNKTNANMIAWLTNIPYANHQQWVGKRITLKPSMTEYQGVPTPCIRVADELPPQPNAQPAFGQTAQGFGQVPQGGPPVDPNAVPF
jgi:hypothetical protein